MFSSKPHNNVIRELRWSSSRNFLGIRLLIFSFYAFWILLPNFLIQFFKNNSSKISATDPSEKQ